MIDQEIDVRLKLHGISFKYEGHGEYNNYAQIKYGTDYGTILDPSVVIPADIPGKIVEDIVNFVAQNIPKGYERPKQGCCEFSVHKSYRGKPEINCRGYEGRIVYEFPIELTEELWNSLLDNTKRR